MIIRKYGITLRRLTIDDIEMVRKARNRDDIRHAMFDQHLITPEEQERWFHSIDNHNNLYFIADYQGCSIGLASGKDMDWQKRENEGGLFIWDTRYIGSHIAARISILMMQFSFELCGVKRTFARINPSNPQAKHYSLAMGYTATSHPNLLVLTQAAYQKHIPKLRYLASSGKDLKPLSIDDIEFPDMAKYGYLYRDLPEDVLSLIRQKCAI